MHWYYWLLILIVALAVAVYAYERSEWFRSAAHTPAFWLVIAFVAIGWLVYENHTLTQRNSRAISRLVQVEKQQRAEVAETKRETLARRQAFNAVLYNRCLRTNKIVRAVRDFHDFFVKLARQNPPNETPQARAVRLRFLRVVGSDLPALDGEDCRHTLKELGRAGQQQQRQ